MDHEVIIIGITALLSIATILYIIIETHKNRHIKLTDKDYTVYYLKFLAGFILYGLFLLVYSFYIIYEQGNCENIMCVINIFNNSK